MKAVHVSYDGGKTFTAPSVANAKDGSYPIVRPLYYYYMTHSEKTVKPFVDYILSCGTANRPGDRLHPGKRINGH